MTKDRTPKSPVPQGPSRLSDRRQELSDRSDPSDRRPAGRHPKTLSDRSDRRQELSDRSDKSDRSDPSDRRPAGRHPKMEPDFPIERAIELVEGLVAHWEEPVVSQMVREKRDPFRVLVATLLSLRTRDEQTRIAAPRLFALADTPQGIVQLPIAQIEEAIRLVGFYHVKAQTIQECCQALLDRHGGQVPNDLDTLLALPGVGRKTANLVLTEGYNLPGICVDTHVHSISNRWGYVTTKTPEETEMALRAKLPPRHWIRYNYLLVSFGQNHCRPQSPHCSTCPLQPFCPALGVSTKR